MQKKSTPNESNRGSFDRRGFLLGAATLGASAAMGVIAACTPESANITAGDSGGASSSPTVSQTSIPGPYFSQINEIVPLDGEMAFVSEAIDSSQITSIEEVDVLVVGAGISGACALAAAVEIGAKALLVEKTGTFAAHGVAAGSIGCKIQKEAGIEIDRDIIVGDAMQSGNYRVNADVIMAWADNSAEALNWLVDTVVTPAGIAAFAPWHETYHESWCNWYPTHINLGMNMFEGMSVVVPATLDYAISKGGEVRYDTPAVQLVREGTNGRVVGAIVQGNDGYIQINASGGVILATGGYENNFNRMKKYFRPRDLAVNSFYMSAGQNTGDGHEMGLAIGAAEDEAPHTMLIAATVGNAWLSVNMQGERFMNNRLPYDYAAQQIAMQPGATAWQVFDSNYEVAIRQWDSESNWLKDEAGGFDIMLAQMATLDEQSIQGSVIKADTLADLAEKIGVPADKFTATIKRWNELCAAGVDTDYGTASAYLTPVAASPFFAQNAGAGCMTTVSGLKIDKNWNVTDLDGRVIDGLYAIGNVSGGMFDGIYTHHINGLSHGRCITGGYMAGRRAAGIV